MNEQPCPGLLLIDCPLAEASGSPRIETIKSAIKAGTVVILKHAVTAEAALQLKQNIVDWRQTQEVVSFAIDTNVPGLNFHRIDAHPEKSLLPHLFHQHGFGALDALPSALAGQLRCIADPMLTLQNAVAGTHYRLATPDVRIKALQYPVGGGFLMKHTHPIDPQGVGLILALSKAGVDYSHGGTTFVTPEGFVDTSPWHDAGDLILFRYDLEHAVGPVDQEREVEWTSAGGRWTLVLELLATHRRSEAA